MKFSNFQRKTVSLIVMFTFLALLHVMAASSAAAPVKGNSETTVQQGESGGPSFIEEEGDTKAVYKKASKFPWLIVGLGVVAAGVAVYFLVIKKSKYTLTVALDAGSTGTPAATTKYKKSEVVNYSYSAKPGYGNLQVKLDGISVPAAGTVTMDKDKTLAVSSEAGYTLSVDLGQGTTGTPAATALYQAGAVVNYSYEMKGGYANLQVRLDGNAVPAHGTVTMDRDHAIATSAVLGASIKINSTPAGAKIYLDNKDSGQVTPHTFSFAGAVTKKVLLRLCGYQDYVKTVSAPLGKETVLNAKLEAGISESFDVEAASCWKPHTASEWTVAGGNYRFQSSLNAFNYNLYNVAFSQTSYSAETKLNRVRGYEDADNALLLVERLEGTIAFGYWFSYSGNYFWIVRFDGYDIYNGNGDYDLLKFGMSTAINNNLGEWNVLKVVRKGSGYSFIINNKTVASVDDATYSPRYLALGMIVFNNQTEMLYDYVKLDFNSAAAMPLADSPCSQPVMTWPQRKK